MDDYGYAISNEGKMEELHPRTGDYFIVPAFGFIEAIEIRFTPPIPNMEAAAPYRMIVEFFAADGTRVPHQVFARFRKVADAAGRK